MSVNTAFPAKFDRSDKGERVVLTGLARALVQHQILRIDQAVAIHKKADASGQASFVDELISSNAITPGKLARFLSETFGMPLMDLQALDISVLPTDLIDQKLLAETQIVPLLKRGNRLSVLLSDPTDQAALDRVKFQQQASVDAIVVEHDKLRKLLDKLGQSAADKLSDMAGDALDIEMTGEEPVVTLEETSDVDDAPVVKFLQKVLMEAIQAGASDIHFEPYEKFYRIRLRIDGELREFAQPPLAIKEKLASRIKVISRLDISEKRVPQDGRMKLVISANRAIDFRVSTLPTLFGEKIVMRILDPSSARLGIEALGYEPEQKAVLVEAIARPYGMVLVTGPTGSG